jgi:hypothetical protein
MAKGKISVSLNYWLAYLTKARGSAAINRQQHFFACSSAERFANLLGIFCFPMRKKLIIINQKCAW